jgi:hypothetical protein
MFSSSRAGRASHNDGGPTGQRPLGVLVVLLQWSCSSSQPPWCSSSWPASPWLLPHVAFGDVTKEQQEQLEARIVVLCGRCVVIDHWDGYAVHRPDILRHQAEQRACPAPTASRGPFSHTCSFSTASSLLVHADFFTTSRSTRLLADDSLDTAMVLGPRSIPRFFDRWCFLHGGNGVV